MPSPELPATLGLWQTRSLEFGLAPEGPLKPEPSAERTLESARLFQIWVKQLRADLSAPRMHRPCCAASLKVCNRDSTLNPDWRCIRSRTDARRRSLPVGLRVAPMAQRAPAALRPGNLEDWTSFGASWCRQSWSTYLKYAWLTHLCYRYKSSDRFEDFPQMCTALRPWHYLRWMPATADTAISFGGLRVSCGIFRAPGLSRFWQQTTGTGLTYLSQRAVTQFKQHTSTTRSAVAGFRVRRSLCPHGHHKQPGS